MSQKAGETDSRLLSTGEMQQYAGSLSPLPAAFAILS